MNPIHGEDLAKVCVDKMLEGIKETTVGGIDIFSHNELAELALKAWGNPIKISHSPDWIRKLTIWFLRVFTTSIFYGSIEFFLTAIARDNVAPQAGSKRLEDFFTLEVEKTNKKR